MSAFSCLFCSHANPAGSRYCNECGSPLRLKPCPECDAVNDLEAVNCYQCSGSLIARSVEVSAVESEKQPAASVSAPGQGLCSAPGPNLPELIEERLDALRRQMGTPREAPSEQRSEASSATAPVQDAVVQGMRACSPVALAQRTLQAAAAARPLPGLRSQRRPYMMVATLMVGIAAWAYILYGPPTQLEHWLSAFGSKALLFQRSYLATTPMRSISQAGATPLASPEPRETAVGSNAEPAARLEVASPRSEALASPVAIDSLVRNADSDAGPAQSDEGKSADPPPPAGVHEALPLAVPAAANALDERPVAAEASKHSLRAAMRRVERPRISRAPSLTAPDVLMPPRANDARAPAGLRGAGSCTQGVAALGLCNPDRRQEAN